MNVIEPIEQLVQEIKQSTNELIYKLDRQEMLDWSDMLNSYQVISSQYTSLMDVLRKSQIDPKMNIRGSILVPTRLSLDPDPQLLTATEGRLESWHHGVVPNYLRTQPVANVERAEHKILEAVMLDKKSPEALNKHILTMCKFCDILSNQLKDATVHTRSQNTQITFNRDDTHTLVRTIMYGDQPKPDATDKRSMPPPNYNAPMA